MDDVNVYFGKGTEGYNNPKFQELLLEERFSPKDLNNITYRTLNYWHEQDFLLTKPREMVKTWRRFNFFEFVWIKLLYELRELGGSLDKNIPMILKKMGHRTMDEINEDLKDPNKAQKKVKDLAAFHEYNGYFKEIKDEQLKFRAAYIGMYQSKILPQGTFVRLVANCITTKQPATIRIYKDKIDIHSPETKLSAEDLKKELLNTYDTFISISINKILEDLIRSGEYNNLPEMPLLNEDEMELLKYVRNKEVKEVTVKLEEGKPVHLEVKDDVKGDVAKRIEEYLFSPYQEIKFKTNGGKTISFERTTKYKLKK